MRKHEITRLEAFSDAVFGFAATLLVVALEVPATFPELVSNLRGFFAFGLSFAMLVLIWAAHNGFFRRFGMVDPGTVVLNSILLFVVLFYVYPLKFLTTTLVDGWVRGGGNQAAGERMGFTSLEDLGSLFTIYGAGFGAIFLCLALMYLRAGRRASALGLNPDERYEAYTMMRHYAIFVLVALISIALAQAGVGLHFGLPGFTYALLGPFCGAHGAWSGRRRRAMQPA
jgi:uncharacterized membrane protein